MYTQRLMAIFKVNLRKCHPRPFSPMDGCSLAAVSDSEFGSVHRRQC